MKNIFKVGLGILLVMVVGSLGPASCKKGPKAGTPGAAGPDADLAKCQADIPSTTLALVGDKPVTAADVNQGKADMRVKAQLIEAQGGYFDLRRKVLDDYLYNDLVTKEAAQQGLSPDALKAKEVASKIPPVTEQDVQAFYDEVKNERTKQGRQTPPLANVADQIRKRLTDEKSEGRRAEYFAGLRKKYSVTYVEPKQEFSRPRYQVAVGDRPPKGNPRAPVTIVEFSEFQCPFCSRAMKTVEQVVEEYGKSVKVYFRDFPLQFHENAMPAAVAARCASGQGKFWKYHDLLFANQSRLKREDLVAYAKELKLDAKKFEGCLDSKQQEPKIEKDMEEAKALDVSGTPAFFINGIPLSGAVPYEKFKEIIDNELALAKSGSANTTVMP